MRINPEIILSMFLSYMCTLADKKTPTFSEYNF